MSNAFLQPLCRGLNYWSSSRETHLFDPEREYILAGDETVVSKAGSETFGTDLLFSGLRGKVIKGLGFFVFSLVDTFERKSYPLAVGQMVRSSAEKEASKARKKKKKKGSKKAKKPIKAQRGRKKGSRNRDRKQFKPSPELVRINALLAALLKLIRKFIPRRTCGIGRAFGTQSGDVDGTGKRSASDFKNALRCGIV